MYVYILRNAAMSTGTCGRQERPLDCLKLELQMVVSSLAGVLGTKLWSSVRAEGTVNF